jgi:hypothetical protein
MLAKILIAPPNSFDYASFRDFEKRIMIVRDPRDNLVSRILFRPGGSQAFRRDETNVAAFTQALRRKEADPRSISLLALIELFGQLTGEDWLPRFTMLTGLALDFHHDNGDFIVYKYEDLVAGNYAAIKDYLGIVLPVGEADVTPQYEYVERTKAARDWQNWFTAEDVAFFRPHLAPYMRAYGYPDDWTLAAEPCIRPEHGSDYVRHSVAFRSRQERDLTKKSGS